MREVVSKLNSIRILESCVNSRLAQLFIFYILICFFLFPYKTVGLVLNKDVVFLY